MNTLIGLVGALFALLLALLGIEKRKNKKKDEKILKQEQEIVQQKKQTEVYKINQDLAAEASEAMGKIEEAQGKIEQEIKEAGTDEEIINIANSIVADFNRVSDRSSE